MSFNGIHGNKKQVTDLLIGFAIINQFNHFKFTITQRGRQGLIDPGKREFGNMLVGPAGEISQGNFQCGIKRLFIEGFYNIP
jgi:hypothetical protein